MWQKRQQQQQQQPQQQSRRIVLIRFLRAIFNRGIFMFAIDFCVQSLHHVEVESVLKRSSTATRPLRYAIPLLLLLSFCSVACRSVQYHSCSFGVWVCFCSAVPYAFACYIGAIAAVILARMVWKELYACVCVRAAEEMLSFWTIN